MEKEYILNRTMHILLDLIENIPDEIRATPGVKRIDEIVHHHALDEWDKLEALVKEEDAFDNQFD